MHQQFIRYQALPRPCSLCGNVVQLSPFPLLGQEARNPAPVPRGYMHTHEPSHTTRTYIRLLTQLDILRPPLLSCSSTPAVLGEQGTIWKSEDVLDFQDDEIPLRLISTGHLK